jgi:hypothetical protein
MITSNRIYCKLFFQFDMTNNPPLATVDTEHGWTLFLGDDAIAIYEFVSKYVDLPEPEDLGIAPPDETE